MMIICLRCKIEKDENEFKHYVQNGKTYIRGQCKQCDKERERQNKIKNNIIKYEKNDILSGELMNYRGLSQYLGRSVSTLRCDVMKHKIPVVRIGSSVRFRKIDIDNWIEKMVIKESNNF